MELSTWNVDPVLAREGTWIDIGEGARVKVGRAGMMNSRFVQASQIHWQAFRSKKFPTPELEEAEKKRIALYIARDSLFLDFEGIKENGVTLVNTPEVRLHMLEYEEFADMIWTAANDRATFSAKIVEEAVGKSEASSNGQPSGPKKRSGSRG